jgi:uncharacterized membrane protein
MSTLPEYQAPPPYVPPPPETPEKTIVRLRLQDPLAWLVKGWQDVRAEPSISAFYGVAFWLMATILGLVFRSRPEYTMSIASGCLLVGPFLAMGLYEVSRRRQLGLPAELGTSVTCWDSHLKSMGMLVLVLIVLELLWGRASLVVFAVFFNTAMPSTSGVIDAIFNPDNFEFVAAYCVVGGGFAVLVFSLSVVSIPMILDRDTDAISAAITSLEVVFTNTFVMLVWGLLIALLVAMALLMPWSVGLVLVGPLLGYASWYAYRGAVEWPAGDVTVL